MQGKLKNMDGHCLTAWDGTGKIFAVGIPRKQIISLYSVDAYDKVSRMCLHAVFADPILSAETVCLGNHRRPGTGQGCKSSTTSVHDISRIFK